jgi:transaldolase
MNKKFFFDTADDGAIKKIWERLKHFQPQYLVAGITTNPNAFAKVNLNTIPEWRERTIKLCELVSSIREDNEGVVYVQIPNSQISDQSFDKWINIIRTFSDGNTKIALKISPEKRFLLKSSLYSDLLFNVTGLTDAATALSCLSYNIRYVSLIPGRMQEIGLDWVSHAAKINNRKPDHKEIIFGSIRDTQELKTMFLYGVPTIGNKIFDAIIEEQIESSFNKGSNQPKEAALEIGEKHAELSKKFFLQMDSLGEKVNNELSNS